MTEPEDVEEDLFADLSVTNLPLLLLHAQCWCSQYSYDADEQANQTTSAGVTAHPTEQVPAVPPQSQTDDAHEGHGFDNQNVVANDIYQNQYQQDFQGGSGFDNGAAHHEDTGEAEPQGGTGIKEDG